MSEQLLVQGKLLGIDAFLASPAPGGNEIIDARSLWITLVCEVVPRALLAELQLAAQLLGASGGAQFLIIIPDSFRDRANDFLVTAARQIASATAGLVTLVWSATEDLGDWTVVRKRLADQLLARRETPLATSLNFEPFHAEPPTDGLFTSELARALRTAPSVGWSPDLPLLFSPAPEKHNWPITSDLMQDGIALARHAAPAGELSESQGSNATVAEMAARSNGRPLFGLLRGDVDDFGLRLRRLQSIEEHVQVSVLYKQFFAGELEILCSMPEFWRRVTVLYSGGNSFAVYGAWDALILLARELQRMFGRFAEQNLKDFPGPEAKTITMACALSQNLSIPLEALYAECGRDLALAKAADKDCIYLLGRVLEWKQLSDAAELKEAVERVSEEFRGGSQFLSELDALYTKVSSPLLTDQQRLLRRAYRFQRRFTSAATRGAKDREFGKLRTHLINEIVGRNVRPSKGKQLKLRPAGVVALEWARLAQSSGDSSAQENVQDT
jgi:CRISPR-associated protein Csm1